MKYIKLFEKIDWEDWEYEEKDPDNKTIGNEHFTQFLIDNDAYDEFVMDIYKRHSTETIEEINKLIKTRYQDKGRNMSEIIDDLLDWENTGRWKFWETLHYRWCNSESGYNWWTNIKENNYLKEDWEYKQENSEFLIIIDQETIQTIRVLPVGKTLGEYLSEIMKDYGFDNFVSWGRPKDKSIEEANNLLKDMNIKIKRYFIDPSEIEGIVKKLQEDKMLEKKDIFDELGEEPWEDEEFDSDIELSYTIMDEEEIKKYKFPLINRVRNVINDRDNKLFMIMVYINKYGKKYKVGIFDCFYNTFVKIFEKFELSDAITVHRYQDSFTDILKKFMSESLRKKLTRFINDLNESIDINFDDFDWEDEPDRQIIGNEMFTQFLIDNDFYEQFVDDLIKIYPYINDIDDINRLIMSHRAENLYGALLRPIVFAKSKKGMEWEKLSRKWNELVRMNYH